MMKQITKEHLAFLDEAVKEFENSTVVSTFASEKYQCIAIREGYDRDNIILLEVGDTIANFVKQLEPKPLPRKEVMKFAHDMESQLKVNEHKGNWKREHHELITGELARNFGSLLDELAKEDKDKHEITIRCANIANFAMMIADNEGEHL